MNMRRFVRLGTVKPNPIPFDAQYCRHASKLVCLSGLGKVALQGALTEFDITSKTPGMIEWE